VPRIKVNDINMYYESHGQGEPIVLISGFSADHTAWDGVIDILAKNNEIIVFDNRGAGQTDVSKGPYSIELLANDTAALCSELGIKKAHFIGNSMGGMIVQDLSYRHSSLVKSVIISNSTLYRQSCFHYYLLAQLHLLKTNAEKSAIVKASCSWLFSFQFLSQEGVLEQLVEDELNNPYPFTIPANEAQLAALASFDSRGWAKNINVKTLVIGSDQDLIFNEASIKEIAKHIPKAQYYCFDNCGHLPQIEYPQQFAKIVSQFISCI